MSRVTTLVPVGRAEDVPFLEGRTVVVRDRRIAVFHTESGYRATAAECPHRGGPLADGLVGGGTVVCPLHSWRIDLASGEVVGGDACIPVYAVLEREGWLYLELDE